MAQACSTSNFTPTTILRGCGVSTCHQFSSNSSNGAAATQLGGWAAGRPLALYVHAQTAHRRLRSTHHRAGVCVTGALAAGPDHSTVVGRLGSVVGGLGVHVQCQRAPSRPAAQLGSSRAVAAVAAELVASGHTTPPQVGSRRKIGRRTRLCHPF